MLDNALIKRLSSSPARQPLMSRPLSSSPNEGSVLPASIQSPSPASTLGSPKALGASDKGSSRGAARYVRHDTELAEPHVTSPATARPSRQRPASQQSDTRLDEVPERPQDPEKVLKMQAVARNRSNDLQNIFTSQHSDRSDGLRTRLGLLNAQGTELRSRIASLERELQEATTERLKDIHRVPSDERIREAKEPNLRSLAAAVEGGDAKDLGVFHSAPNRLGDSQEGTLSVPAEDGIAVHYGSDDGGSSSASQAPVVLLNATDRPRTETQGTETSFANRPSLLTQDTPTQVDNAAGLGNRPHSASKRYEDEVLMPLLVRRRAEARFKEASFVHENSINQMKAELQEIERRTVKQQNWMKQVDAQVLKVELTKASYQVRLESARKRVATLGSDLSLAYENMTALLEERLEVEDLAAKNDALVWYLHTLGLSDQENASAFIDNKKDLLFLNERSAKLRSKRLQLDNLLEQVRCTQLLATDIVKHSEELAFLSEQLHALWNLVPVEWKDSVFKSVQKGLTSPLSMHPVNAIQALQGASSHVSSAMKSYLRAVSEFIDNAHSTTSRRRAFKAGRVATVVP